MSKSQKEQPPPASTFLPDTCLNFIYKYPSLPEGLLPRFIVRTHTRSQQRLRWRTGVILHYANAQALVRVDRHDRQVVIRIKGGNAETRRNLLAIIRDHFEHIHTAFDFEISEWIPIPDYPNEPPISYRELLQYAEAGEPYIRKSTKTGLVKLDVQKLLSGIDLPRAVDGTEPIRVFFSYAHEDEAIRDELATHLSLLQRQGYIRPWHDREIRPGASWSDELDRYLEEADLVLLLVSSAFIDSDYCHEIEMKRALERHEENEARVVPIIVRDVDWQIAEFARLQALPQDGKSVDTWANRDTAWRNVAEGLRELIEKYVQHRTWDNKRW